MSVTSPEHDPANPDPLLTAAQAARYLGISERSTRRLLALGGDDPHGLQAVRIGSLVRVRRSALEAYIREQSR